MTPGAIRILDTYMLHAAFRGVLLNWDYMSPSTVTGCRHFKALSCERGTLASFGGAREREVELGLMVVVKVLVEGEESVRGAFF